MIIRKMFDNVIIEMTRQISYPVDGDPIEAIKEDLADQEFIIQSVDSLVIDEKKVLCDSLNPCNSFWKTNITASLNVLMNCPNNILFIGEENCKVNIKPSPLYTSGQEKFNCEGVYKFISHVTYEYKNISFPITKRGKSYIRALLISLALRRSTASPKGKAKIYARTF